MLRDKVEDVLRDSPDTRNSDIELVKEVWRRFYDRLVWCNLRGEESITLSALNQLPTHESIKRIRAQFNEQFHYLPTDINVVRQRKINEDKWREKNGYPPREEIKYSSDKSTSYTDKVLDQPDLLSGIN